MPDRPYIFYELTNSLCAECLQKVETKVILQDGCVYLLKHCKDHGRQKVLISTDEAYYKQCREFLKPGQMPLRFNTPIERGCPFDCGLCPDHEQHSCLTLIEVTERCNLACPICYADSSPNNGAHRSLDVIDTMLNAVVANEGEPDVVQISGGEPTIHPQFFEILDLAKSKPIKHLMVNTNGLKIAEDPAFAERLATYAPGFEVYLQFDSLRPEPYEDLRGANLLAKKLKALDYLNALNLSTTLVVTLKKGLNDGEMGDLIDFALQQPAVRGVTFQPIQSAGRTEDFDPATDRLTVGEVRQQILAQSPLFTAKDVLPVPCHPDCIAMAYALKVAGQVLPLSGVIDPKVFLHEGGNTIRYEEDPALKARLFDLFALNHSPQSTPTAVQNLLCCLPTLQGSLDLKYENVFRVIIMSFLDPYNFDVRSVKRSCIHIAHPDGRIIPFDTYNLFYRTSATSPLTLGS